MENPNPSHVAREARLRWVPIEKIEYPAIAQRDRINRAFVDRLAANFDLEQLGTPTVNERGGHFWCMDGMHRIEGMKLIGWGDQQVQCWTYTDLTDEQMAERFLKLNDTLTVNAFDKFRVGINAGRVVETDIDRIVRSQDLTVGRTDDSVSAVGTLYKIYQRGGPRVLQKTLAFIRDTYGMPGFDAPVLDGISLFIQRYDGILNYEVAAQKLGAMHGSVNGLLGKAEVLRKQTGNQKGHCVAAAAVDVINAGRGGNKLPSWFRAEDAA